MNRWLSKGLAVGFFTVSLFGAQEKAVHAQDASEFQLWNAVLATASLDTHTPSLALWMDTHVRRGNAGTVHIARPGLGLVANENVSLWGGYAWVPVFSDDDADPRNEHRLWQQLIVSLKPVEQLSLQSRTRFEQRFMEGGDEIGLRLRQFVRISWQFTRQPAPGVGVVLWNETFLGLGETDWGQPGGLDQNRLFIGPVFKLSSWARLEPGYLLVYIDRKAGDNLVHAFSVNLFLSPRF